MSSGKVKCTCGWSWNKSDSSKKDMYICHECGRDNSNNMKNGGWLDNYNDSEVSLPEGYVGEGYNTSGRDYSPAWGGQFEDGGFIPIAQKGKEVPAATRADSLDVYNRALKIDAYYENLRKKGWYPKREITPTRNLTSEDLEDEMRSIDKESRETYKKQSKESKEYSRLKNVYPNADPKTANLKALAEHIKLTRGTRYASKDNLPSIIDPMAPTTVIDTRIIPKERVHYETISGVKVDEFLKKYPNPTKAQENKFYKELEKLENIDPPSGTAVNLYRYDPLSVKPWDMLTDAEKKLRVEKYGTDGVPKSYLSKTSTKKEIDKPIESKPKPVKVKPQLQPRVEALNLRPIEQTPINIPVQELDFNTPIKAPKSYNVNMQRYNMQGPSDYYQANEEGVDYQRAIEIKAASDAYNKYIQEKYGNEDALKNPKAVERLKQLRQNVEVVPQYQMGGKLTFLQPTSEKLPQGYRIPYADPSSELAMSIGGEDGEPAYLIPSFKYGRPLENPMEEFKKTGEHLGGPFKTWQEADQWEQEVRHPYVEKGQAIPMPIKTWGEMAMGGSIPGSVGFTYARTNSPAPSNGKYAKKTMASAQDGEKVFNKKVTESTSTSKDRIPVSSKNIIKTLPGTNVHVNNKGEVVVKDEKGVYKPYKSQQSEIKQGKKKSAKEYKKEQEIIKEMQSDNLGLRAPLHYLANPDHMLGDLGNFTGFKPLQQFSNSDEDARRYNFQALDPSKSKDERLSNNFNEALNLLPKAGVNLTLGRLASKTPIGGLIEAYNPIPLPYSLGMKIDPTDFWKGVENNSDSAGLIHSQNIFPIRTSIAPELRQGIEPIDLDIFNKKIDPRFDEYMRKAQLQPSTSKEANSVLSDFKKRIKTPEGIRRAKELGADTDYLDKLKLLEDNTTYGYSEGQNIGLHKNLPEEVVKSVTRHEIEHGVKNAIQESNMKKAGKWYKNLPFMNNSAEKMKALNTNTTPIDDILSELELRNKPSVFDELAKKDKFPKENIDVSDFKEKLSNRQAAIDYFDRGSQGNEKSAFAAEAQQYMLDEGIIKHPYEIITPEKIKEAHAKALFDKKNPIRLFHIMKNTDKNYNTVAKALNKMLTITGAVGAGAASQMGEEEPIPGMKQGGIIKDDRGQWNHPGEITEIGSNQITMQGVPYPVLGVSDEGDVQMMYPEEEYKFVGKKVTEFPMAKNGIRQEQKGLVNLDQLTNFTNYNTKQPGGWMDKYQ